MSLDIYIPGYILVTGTGRLYLHVTLNTEQFMKHIYVHRVLFILLRLQKAN